MGKQINSAKKMESSSKNSSNSVAMKDSKKINDYFSLGNRKRNRDESEKSKSQSILKPHTKDNNQINSISLVSSERNSESKERSKNNVSVDSDLGKVAKENHKLINIRIVNNTTAIIDLSLEENVEENIQKSKKKKENSNICSICRDGGNLLLCDKCPKSFHTHCLKMTKNSVPDREWFCPACLPKLERQKQRELEFDERRKIRNEKKKLWRLKKKEEMKNKTIENANFASIPLINNYIIERLAIERKKFENKQLSGTSSRLKHKNKMKSLSAKNKLQDRASNSSKKIVKGDSSNKTINKKNDIEEACLYEDRENKLNSSSSKSDEMIEISINENPKNNSNMNGNNNSSSNTKNNSDIKDKLKSQEINNKEIIPFTNISTNRAKITKIQVKYPIDDYELYANPEKYNLSENYFNKPKGVKSFIPDRYYTKIIKIWDVLDTFKSIFNLTQFYPEDLYVALNYYGEKELSILNDIHIALIKKFYEQINTKELKEFFDDNNMLMFKITYENTQIENFKYIWLEIFRFLSVSPFFGLMVTDELKDLSKRLSILKYTHYNMLSIDEKIMILEYFCNSILDTNAIRDLIKNEIERKRELKAEISALELELKSFESRKKELERQEKFTQPKLKIEILTKRLDALVEENPNLSRVELTKLRKELELEREQFKSVLKEADILEVNRGKLISKMEKIELDLYNLGTIHKKLIGIDGLKTEYYFHYTIPNKIFVKKCVSKDILTNLKTFEWSEINNDEEIKKLLTCLSEKGIRETNLAHKIKKLLNKKLKFNSNVTVENRTEEEILKKILANSKEIDIENDDSERKFFCEIFEMLEHNISDYLKQDKKEWESFQVRQDLFAFINSSDSIPELAKSLLLLNERFKNPYKLNDFKNKIISDEEEYSTGSIITFDGKINMEFVDQKRILAPKTKVWSNEYLEIDLEEHFMSYLEKARSMKSIILASIFYDGITADLVKRREVYKHFKKRDPEIEPIHNVDPYLTSLKVNMISEPKKESLSLNNKKIINDYDEFYYDDEQFEMEHKINKEKLEKAKESLNNIYMPNTRESTRRSLRNIINTSANNSFNNNNKSFSAKETKQNIKWNNECFVCEDGGDLILCEKCPNVAHIECVNLTKEPDTWTCEQCLSKLVIKRMTRSNKI